MDYRKVIFEGVEVGFDYRIDLAGMYDFAVADIASLPGHHLYLFEGSEYMIFKPR